MKCCEITAATLRHRIDLQRAAEVPDGQGGNTRTWTSYAGGVRAFVEPLTAGQLVKLEAIRSPMVARAYMRWRADVQPGDAVLFDGRRYGVIGAPVDIENAQRWLELKLEAVAAI